MSTRLVPERWRVFKRCRSWLPPGLTRSEQCRLPRHHVGDHEGSRWRWKDGVS